MRAELVGREAEMAVLTDSLAAALDGLPRVVVCEGEAGIGKTRLAQELLGVAERRGVLWA
jgi:predicted ATPase